MKPEVKTVEQLIEEGLITEGDLLIDDMIKRRYWTNTVALIFHNKTEAANYIKNFLAPKIGVEKIISIWSCLIGPADEDALGKAMGIIPDDGEKWLLFKKEDFEQTIKPAM